MNVGNSAHFLHYIVCDPSLARNGATHCGQAFHLYPFIKVTPDRHAQRPISHVIPDSETDTNHHTVHVRPLSFQMLSNHFAIRH